MSCFFVFFSIFAIIIRFVRYPYRREQTHYKFNETLFLYAVFCVVYNFREKEQYCYENTETGEIQWEYPDLEQPSMQENNVLDDDEMDISTTPPPNEAAFYPANGTTLSTPSSFEFLTDFSSIFRV